MKMKLKKNKIILRLKEISKKKKSHVLYLIPTNDYCNNKIQGKISPRKEIICTRKKHYDTVKSLHLKSNSATRLRTEIGPQTKQKWKYSRSHYELTN